MSVSINAVKMTAIILTAKLFIYRKTIKCVLNLSDEAMLSEVYLDKCLVDDFRTVTNESEVIAIQQSWFISTAPQIKAP